jgi:hypothetical protein
MKLPRAANENLTDRTMAIWQPRLGRQISREEARQIAENVTGFFSILDQWSRDGAAANDNERPAVRGETP